MATKAEPKITYPDRQAEHELALAHLQALVKSPGMLKVVTADHACPGGPQPKTPEERAACEAHAVSVKKAPHQVLHDVVRIEQRADGKVVAETAEGDWCRGYPADLLRRLLEHVTEA
jgi:NADPH-dependent 2,4-dienoyl-CoA reductase/sulfur reductase-like enzyme